MAAPIQQLGPYRLSAKLGQGGMGSVYVGFDGQERVAVKVLAPSLAAEEGFRARFEAEIESLKKLRHPNIVRLIAYGEQDGYLYYSMELVEGTSLEDELRQGRRFTWREVTRIAVAVCKALKLAHDHGVIHRDIKPANLLLSADGEVKLSDFGIARLFGNSRMTSEGGVLGTAEYMAPEQADGRTATDRCDQYSLGGVMYALLAGRPPFRASSLVEMLQLQRFGEPQPVRYFAPDTPIELERIIHQLLAKEPQKRFTNTLFLSRSLEAMEMALSRTAERLDFVVTRQNQNASPNSQVTQIDPLAATLLPGESVDAQAVTRGPQTLPPAAASQTDHRVTAVDPSEGYSIAEEPSEAQSSEAAPAARFTKVDDAEEAAPAGSLDFLKELFSLQSLALLAGLALTGLVALWLLRPPSADRLYDEIEPLAHDGSHDKLLEAQGPIDDFLARFPEDPRAAEVAGFREQATLAAMEHRLEIAARRRKLFEVASPAERAYLEAVQTAASRPEQALAHFRSLVDLCEAAPQSAATERQVLELARRQVSRLEGIVASQNDADRAWARTQLDLAATLAATDPAAAAKIRAALVDLLADRPGLADVVREARGALGVSGGAREPIDRTADR